jgi:GNAT superfamily N-acetyltransferase
MPAIEIRPVIETDIAALAALDHNYTSNYVWQMELDTDNGEINVRFREIQLPRSVRVEYPHSTKELVQDWKSRSGLLVALLDGKPVGYVGLMENIVPLSAWVTDLVVAPSLRRQGIGTALVLAAQEWTAARPHSRRLILEIQPKNHPALCLAQKMGFDFSGYSDHHFANHDLAIFFAKWV